MKNCSNICLVKVNLNAKGEINNKQPQQIEKNSLNQPKYIHGYKVEKRKLNPIVRLILLAVYDENNVWHILVGMRYLVQHIYELSCDPNNIQFSSYIKLNGIFGKELSSSSYISFPSPHNININMMPFIMSLIWEKTKLPIKLESYWDIIKQCIETDHRKTLEGKIGYLTIHESYVSKGLTQRRPGYIVNVLVIYI